jgi:hypothetical protein
MNEEKCTCGGSPWPGMGIFSLHAMNCPAYKKPTDMSKLAQKFVKHYKTDMELMAKDDGEPKPTKSIEQEWEKELQKDKVDQILALIPDELVKRIENYKLPVIYANGDLRQLAEYHENIGFNQGLDKAIEIIKQDRYENTNVSM